MTANKHIELKKFILNLFAINLALLLIFTLSNARLQQFLFQTSNFALTEKISSSANELLSDFELKYDEIFRFIKFVSEKLEIELKDFAIKKLQANLIEGETIWQYFQTNFKS